MQRHKGTEVRACCVVSSAFFSPVTPVVSLVEVVLLVSKGRIFAKPVVVCGEFEEWQSC